MKNYDNRDWLYEMYINKDLSQMSIAKICDIDQSIIHRRLVKFGIPRRKFCGRSGSHCHLWKGGITTSSQGYIHIRCLNHPRTDCRGYVPEQILVVEKYTGRTLAKEEAVHHINGIKADNRIENLYLFPSESEHQRYHQLFKRGKRLPITSSNLFVMNE